MVAAQHRIVLMNEYVAKGFAQGTAQANNLASSQTKVNQSMLAQSTVMRKNSSSMLTQNAQFGKSTVSLNKLDVAQGKATAGRKDFLTQFTKMRWAIVNIAMIAAVVYGLGKLAKSSMNTQFEFRRLSLVMNSSMTEVKKSFDVIRASTIAGNDEIVKAMQELGKAGFDLAESQQILEGASGAALIGFSSLGDTATATAQTLRQFNIDVSESVTVSNQLAAAANLGKVDIEDMGQAMKFAGAIAHQTNTPVMELMATIALLSNKGLQLTQIGRGIRQSLLSLLSPSSMAESELSAYGIEIEDANGEMKTFIDIIKELKKELGGLSEHQQKNVLGKIFPSNAISVVLELMDGMTGAVDEAEAELAGRGEAFAGLEAVFLKEEQIVKTESWLGQLKHSWDELSGAILKVGQATDDSFTGLDMKARLDEAQFLHDEYGALSDAHIALLKEISSSPASTQYVKKDGVYADEEKGLGSERFYVSDVTKVDAALKVARELTEEVKKIRELTKDSDEIVEEKDFLGTEMPKWIERLGFAKDAVANYAGEVERIKSEYGDTAEAQFILNQHLESFTSILKDAKGSDVAKMFKERNNEIERGAEKLEDYASQIAALQAEIVNLELKEVRNDIADVNDEIDNLLNRRFNIRGIGESDVGHMVRQQELELNKAKFATLGLGSAEDFLRNASVLTADAINLQTDALDDLTNAAVSSEDRFDAWKTSLSETIRALLINSQDIDRDVTTVVRNARTELLGFTQFDRGGGDQFTQMEDHLGNLRAAQGIFFGEEEEKMQYSEELREDRINGVNESAAQAIAALEVERAALVALEAEEQLWIDKQPTIRDEIDANIAKIEEYTQKIRDLNDELAKSNTNDGSSGSGSGSSSDDEDEYEFIPMDENGIYLPLDEATEEIEKLKKKKKKNLTDFIDPELLSGGLNDFINTSSSSNLSSSSQSVVINVNGAQSPMATAVEVKRQLSSLA